jgi:hypothetical protein
MTICEQNARIMHMLQNVGHRNYVEQTWRIIERRMDVGMRRLTRNTGSRWIRLNPYDLPPGLSCALQKTTIPAS